MMPSPSERLTFDEITTIFRNEEKSNNLSEIRKDFYPAFREYLRKKKAESEEEIRKDPYSVKASGMASEIKKATQKGTSIFQMRIRKVMVMAAQSAYGSKLNLERLTEEERLLYEATVEEVKACKSLAMEGQEIATRHHVPASPCALPSAVDEMGACAPMVLIRMLEDMPSFKGPTHTLKLAKDEVVYLPATVGCALVRSGKAVEISVGQK